MHLPQEYADYVQYEIDNYQRFKEELEEAKLDIIHGRGVFGDKVTSSKISTPTENKALKMFTSPYLKRISRNLNAIEKVLHLDGPEKEYLNQVYLNGSGRKNKELNRRLIRKVAQNMGLIK